MRQNATPFYLRGQSAESASQAKLRFQLEVCGFTNMSVAGLDNQ